MLQKNQWHTFWPKNFVLRSLKMVSEKSIESKRSTAFFLQGNSFAKQLRSLALK